MTALALAHSNEPTAQALPPRDPSMQGLADRLMSHVEVSAAGCWLWTGSVTPGGYGQIGVGSLTDGSRRLAQAHRVAFEVFVCDIPDGAQLDHLCRVRRCIHPHHVQAVTHSENVRRGEGGRHQSQKTHCPKGHEYDEANTYTYKGRRFCRACQRLAGQRLYWKNKGAGQ